MDRNLFHFQNCLLRWKSSITPASEDVYALPFERMDPILCHVEYGSIS